MPPLLAADAQVMLRTLSPRCSRVAFADIKTAIVALSGVCAAKRKAEEEAAAGDAA